ncbi:hypothetical protein [Pseudolactococcus insecticola]|uniref:Uncharacterized protein n=1 Tax=Pseudolactococcus insecticola TaxID=2709158 RepID=A0A6A0B7S0_9LACT|nr:hypothetical protein [Lactococcus insecticola]GFH40703.1 hypothetical protein Hs20B_11010 [Lactococcus insecticola]
MTATEEVLNVIDKGVELTHPHFSDWVLDIEKILFEKNDDLEKENAELNDYLQTEFVYFVDTYADKDDEQFRNEIKTKLDKIKSII